MILLKKFEFKNLKTFSAKMDVTIDADKFFERMDRLFVDWNTHKNSAWGGAEALCIPLGTYAYKFDFLLLCI